MAGLVPAIHESVATGMKFCYCSLVARAWVYITTNPPNGILYTGVTNGIVRRTNEHREGLVPGFTKRYALKRLVYAEAYDDISTAIQRERNMKHWPRKWKVRLILAVNPNWDDLYDCLG